MRATLRRFVPSALPALLLAACAGGVGTGTLSDSAADGSEELELRGQIELRAQGHSADAIRLSWNDVSGETFYAVERSLEASGGFQEIATTGRNVIEYLATALTPGNTYYFRVRAGKLQKSGSLQFTPYSNVASSAVLPPGSVGAPGAPASLLLSVVSTSQIDLRWADNSNDEDGFEIQRCIGSSCGTFVRLASVGPNVTSYGDTGLAVGTTYCYRVRAFNASGASSPSNIACATTSAPLPGGWIRQFGSAATDALGGLASDAAGNLYGAGYTSGSLDGRAADGTYDIVLFKYAPDGTQIFTRQLAGPSHELARAIAVASDGSIYLAGGASGNGLLVKLDALGVELWRRQLDSGLAYEILTGVAVGRDERGVEFVAVSGFTGGALGGPNTGRQDAFAARFSTSGAQEWVHQLGSPNQDEAVGVALDGRGALYLVGSTEGALPDNALTGRRDAFLAKISSSGSRQWIRQFGFGLYDTGNSVAVSGDFVYVGGRSNVLFNGGPAEAADLLVAKFGADGARAWVKQHNLGGTEGIDVVAADAAGNLYASGHSCVKELFVQKYDPHGNPLSIRASLGSPGNDWARGLVASPDGAAIFLGGHTDGAFPGYGNAGPAGSWDLFLRKL